MAISKRPLESNNRQVEEPPLIGKERIDRRMETLVEVARLVNSILK